MIDDKRLATIRGLASDYSVAAYIDEAELLELVQCYEAARAVTRGYDSDLFDAAMDRMFALFPEATNG
jgi:hypothetical protein